MDCWAAANESLATAKASFDNASEWIETLRGYADLGFDTLILWPQGDLIEQIERVAEEVVPHV